MPAFQPTVIVTNIETGVTTTCHNPIVIDCNGKEVFVTRLLTLLCTAKVAETDNGTRYQFNRNGCRIWFYAV